MVVVGYGVVENAAHIMTNTGCPQEPYGEAGDGMYCFEPRCFLVRLAIHCKRVARVKPYAPSILHFVLWSCKKIASLTVSVEGLGFRLE